MATTTLGNKAVGSIIQLKENGKLVSFYVAKHNYENSLNGMGRTVAVPDRNAAVQVHPVAMADPEDKSQVGASIPGMVSKVSVQPGDAVEENQVIAVIEAMKMETSVVARMAGIIDQVLVREGSSVKAGELLMTIKVK